MPQIVSCDTFTQFLVDEQPKYDKEIIESIRPNDGWIGHVATGEFPAHSGNSLIQDRFEVVYPDTTKTWDAVQYQSCAGNPCDPKQYTIGWGSSRISYSLETQTWVTPLMCFEQQMLVTHAQEQFDQIIRRILKPATIAIQGSFARKRALFQAVNAGNGFVASATFGQPSSQFAFQWLIDASGSEGILVTSAMPTSKLTPQMLQVRFEPINFRGYFGTDPFDDEKSPPLIELVTGMTDNWELDKLATSVAAAGGPTLASNWRFTEFAAANKFWRYGYSGQIGNYATRVDPMQMRFNYRGLNTDAATKAAYPYAFDFVQPYVNNVSSGAGGAPGLKSDYNPAYLAAQYAFTFVWHKKAMELLTLAKTTINPEMPYVVPDWSGQWRFLMHDLGADCHGCVIDNKFGNKGLFAARFKQAIRPVHPEWAEAYFHQREPACIMTIAPCNASPGYPTQNYNSANTPCNPPGACS